MNNKKNKKNKNKHKAPVEPVFEPDPDFEPHDDGEPVFDVSKEVESILEHEFEDLEDDDDPCCAAHSIGRAVGRQTLSPALRVALARLLLDFDMNDEERITETCRSIAGLLPSSDEVAVYLIQARADPTLSEALAVYMPSIVEAARMVIRDRGAATE